jgi:hypothetical protein
MALGPTHTYKTHTALGFKPNTLCLIS